MPENLGDRERPSSTPDGVESGQPERPGYPPPGHAEHQTQLAAAEAADTAATGDVEAETDAALQALETPDEAERLAAISTWVAEALPDCQPTELAAQACWEIEQEEWEFGELEYRVTDELPEDIQPDVERYITIHGQNVEIAENTEVIDSTQAAVDDKQAAVAAGEKEIAGQQVAIAAANTEAARRLGTDPAMPVTEIPGIEQWVERELAEAEAIEAQVLNDEGEILEKYAALKIERGGSVGALQALETMVHPRVQEVIRARLATIAKLQSALPGKGEAITRLLNASNVSLTGPDSAAFSDFMTAVDASDEFTEAEKATLRQVLDGHGDRPRNATDLQRRLAQGRGTEQITETETVEDPPGSGNYVEREVVVGEKVLPFTEADRLVLSDSNPRVTTYPDPVGGTRYRIVGDVEGGAPVSIWREIPESGSFPAADINNAMNELFVDALFRNRGMAGGVQALFGIGDSSFGVETDVDANAIGRVELTQGFIRMFSGENTTLGNRFLTGSELAELGQDMRHLAPDGDFGAFNQMDPAATAGLMRALFGEGHAQILANMERAQPFINTGGAEAPSFQRLYAKMYPEDVAVGFSRLREIIGEDRMARLSLPSTEADLDQAA